jgi:hypothetical protein
VSIESEIQNYAPKVKKYLIDTWGLHSDFADKMSFILLCWIYKGITFTITSGYRSPEHQQELIDAYNAGARNVFTPAPVGKSLHQGTTWIGAPASLALDCQTSNPALAAQISHYFGVVWGGAGDPVHFGARAGSL